MTLSMTDDGKSLQFVMSRLKKNNKKGINVEKSYVVRGDSVIDSFADGVTECNVNGTSLDGKSIDAHINIVYNPDANFDYYTNYLIRHDGTIMFEYKAIVRCLEKIYNLYTYYTPAGFPEGKCNITFTIGDFVVENTYDVDGAPKDKRWMCTVTEVFLPIKYKIEHTK